MSLRPPLPKRSRDQIVDDFLKDVTEKLQASPQQERAKWKPGMVMAMRIESFLGHDLIHANFGPSLNFITGRNGSGKSSILSAIITVLGERATVTGRADSLQGLIKNGFESANLMVAIHNIGPLAFEPDVHGPIIVIQRILRRAASGKTGATSQYKLYRQTRQGPGALQYFSLTNVKTEAIHRIVDFFNYQTSNRMAVLNQDEAKRFLVSSSASEKYSMVMSGAMLDQTKRLIAESRQNAEKLSQNIVNAKDRAGSFKRHLDEKRRVFQALERIGELRHQLEMARYQVQIVGKLQRRNILSQREMELRYFLDRVQGSSLRDELTSRIEALLRDTEALRSETDAGGGGDGGDGGGGGGVAQRLERLRTEKILARDEIASAESTLSSAQSSLTRARGELDEQARRLGHLQRATDLHTSSSQADVEQLRQELESCTERLQLAQAQFNEVDTHYKELSTRKNDLTADFQVSSDKMARHRSMVETLTRVVEQLQRMVASQASAASQGGQLSLAEKGAFYHPMFRTLRLPEDTLGPIGLYVRIKDRRWYPALDRLIGRQMTHIITTNPQRLPELSRLIAERQYRGQAVYFGGPTDRRYPVASPLADFPSPLDFIEVTHNAVFNYLVDIAKLDRCVFIADGDQCKAYIEAHGRQHGLAGFTMQGERYDATRSGGVLFQHAERIRFQNFLPSDDPASQGPNAAADAAEQIETNSRALAQEQEHIRTEQSTFESLRAQVDEAERTLRSTHAELNEHYLRKERLLREETHLRQRLQAASQLSPADVASQATQQQQDLEAARDAVERQEARLRLLVEDTGRHEAALAQARAKLRDIDEQAHRLQEQQQENQRVLRAKELELAAARTQLAEQIEREEHDRQTLTQQLGDLQQELGTLGQAIADLFREMPHSDSGSQHGDGQGGQSAIDQQAEERLLLSRSQQSYQQDVENLEHEIEELRCTANAEDAERLRQEIALMSESHQSGEFQIERLERLYPMLAEIIQLQTDRAELFKEQFSIVMRGKFKDILRKCFSLPGHLNFNHEDRQLDIELLPAEGATAAGGPLPPGSQTVAHKKTTQLSGGERSLATLCLLLALWGSISGPLRCLDEFDVGMDESNRRRSRRALVDGTAEIKKQVFVISPLDVGVDTSNPEVSVNILTLADPKRSAQE
ncbi:hypothetical protein H696_02365 [Fonticula alba]|uniref:RecF/RecN/SMC N-terminal domain-containing protein n=1 Tax=Fonticula alba TaxID=691883 RepID=A0A058ZBW7_FONAL|nr:hypothetical protein H696_02365 [Fonticula alba]KCV71418.1 hypothetical protein H696_02365 [Fonticula alba]|eukprot:XP_009494541.1 hypothetical protein H696_02365 [Fonticula alba]